MNIKKDTKYQVIDVGDPYGVEQTINEFYSAGYRYHSALSWGMAPSNHRLLVFERIDGEA